MRRSSMRLAPRNFSTIGSRGREHCVAALGEPGPEDAVVVEIGEAPSSAVNRGHEGKFPRPLRRIQVPFQRYAAVDGIFDFAALAGCTVHFPSLPFSAAARPLL